MSATPSPNRLRTRSFLNNPPPESPTLPSHSILLNGSSSTSGAGARDRSPGPSTYASSEHSHGGQSDTESLATRASQQSVSFAPLPVIPPELKRRSSITLGVAARKNLLSSPEDSIYPDPKKAGGHHGGIQKIYMNDQDWEEYKKHHAEKNGNDPVDLGDLVKDGAKNLWRKVRSSPSPKPESSLGLGTSPTPSTSSIASSRVASSPGSGGGILSNYLTSPRMSIRRRGSDPGANLVNSNSAATTKSPDLPDVEEEALSRMQSRETPAGSHSTSPGINSHFMDWQRKSRLAPTSMEPEPISADDQDTADRPGERPHHPPSPPPRVEDVLPSRDEVQEGHQGVQESIAEELELEDDMHKGGGALGLEKVDIRSEAGDIQEWKQEWSGSKRDSAVLGFDRRRFGAGEA